jgi:hypothetical protein
MATTDGSLRTMPSPRTYTSVFAVPRSTAMSRPTMLDNESRDAIELEILEEIELKMFPAMG